MSTYYYLTEYVPVRFSATYEQKQARQIVYNFKDGMYNESLMNKFTGAINNIGKSNAMVCFIPASSNERTQKRFGRLSSYINSHSNWTADLNAIRRSQDSLPGHVYGKSSNPAGDFVINSSVRGKNIILIFFIPHNIPEKEGINQSSVHIKYGTFYLVYHKSSSF